MKKITDKQIAKEFGITPQTVHSWKNGSECKKKLYQTMKNSLLQENLIIWEVKLKDGTLDYINNCIVSWYVHENRNNIDTMKIFN